MDELVDILDSNGNATGETALKSEAHRLGLFHPTVHVWFFTQAAELLFQKRDAGKKTFPSLWDVSVAGHVAAGEAITLAAVREVKEEIGLAITPKDLIPVGIFKTVHQHSEQLVDAEFNHCFLVELQTAISELSLQPGEVEAVRLMRIDSIESLMKSNGVQGFVPFESKYWNDLINKVTHHLK